jgi:hypothetical protein
MRNPTNDEAPSGGAPPEASRSNQTANTTLSDRSLDRNDSIPIFNVLLNDPLAEVPTVSGWCEHCQHEHTHGLAGSPMEVGTDLGHRSTHCYDRDDGKESPYKETGYNLLLVGVKPARDDSTVPRRRPSALTQWLYRAVTVGCDPGPLPPAVKPLGQSKLSMSTLATCDQTQKIVSYVADRDESLMLVAGVPDSREWRPLCFGDSQTMTIAIPATGALLGSIVSELALLHVRTREDASNDRAYQRRKNRIKKLVLAWAREQLS